MPRLIKKYIKAKRLRSRGYSLKEISRELDVSKSTVSRWLCNYPLSKQALKRLKKRGLEARVKSAKTKFKKRRKRRERLLQSSKKFLESVRLTKDHQKIICALLYWCEGGKDTSSGIKFTNSDPLLVKTFLKLFRSAFNIEESKLHVLLHLHSYHDRKKQKEYWSQITGIPIGQFYKIYQKSHTGKRTKEDYPGCAVISYFDAEIMREIRSLYEAFTDRMSV